MKNSKIVIQNEFSFKEQEEDDEERQGTLNEQDSEENEEIKLQGSYFKKKELRIGKKKIVIKRSNIVAPDSFTPNLLATDPSSENPKSSASK